MAGIQTWQFVGSEVEFVTIKDAAQYLGCLRSTVWQYIGVGLLSAVEIESRWFIEWAAVQALAERRGQECKAG